MEQQKIIISENSDGVLTIEWSEERKKENLIQMQEKEVKNIIVDCLDQFIESDKD